jgi:hypothetical protein
VSGLRHIGKRAAAAALFSFSLCLPELAAAQAEAVAKPAVKVGDRWTYRRMDYRQNRPAGEYTIRAVFADRGVIQIVGVGKGSATEVDTTYTDEWNAVSTRERIFDPHTGWLRFPLRPGDSYPTKFESRAPKKGAAHFTQERTVRVLGWEEVVVPAGKFRALKVESAGRFQRLDQKGGGQARNVIWYVPEVRRWVKLVLETRTPRGVVEHSGEELVSFQLQ